MKSIIEAVDEKRGLWFDINDEAIVIPLKPNLSPQELKDIVNAVRQIKHKSNDTSGYKNECLSDFPVYILIRGNELRLYRKYTSDAKVVKGFKECNEEFVESLIINCTGNKAILPIGYCRNS